MLGDADSPAATSVRRIIEKAGLAVVDMTHHRDDGRPRLQAGRIIRHLKTDLDIGFGHALDAVAKFLRDQLGGLAVNGLRLLPSPRASSAP